MASYFHYRSESVVSLIRGDTDAKSGLEIHGLNPNDVHLYETFPDTTPVWEVTDAYIESIEPASSGLPFNTGTGSPTHIKTIIHPKLELGIFVRDQIVSDPSAYKTPFSFAAFNSGDSSYRITNEIVPFTKSVTLSDVDRVIRTESRYDVEVYTGSHIDRFNLIGSVEIPFFSIGSHGKTAITYFENFRSIINPPVVENAGTQEETIVDIKVGSNLLIDTVSRYESGQQITGKFTTNIVIDSEGYIEQQTTTDVEINTTISRTDERDAAVVTTSADITVGVNYNEVESQSFTFVKALTYEKARIDYEYQVNTPKQRTLINTEIDTLLQDIDTFSTTFVLIVTGGAEEIGGSDQTIPYNRGTVDYQIERYVLSRFIKKRDGNNYVLPEATYNIIDMRDGSQFEVINLPVYSPDGLDNYSLGNAGLSFKTFENNVFIDSGVNHGNTLDAIERIYGDQIRIEDFDVTVRGHSAVLQDGVRFQLGIPTIQTPVTIAQGGLVSNNLTVQSTEYFDDSGKLLFAHGDNTISVYNYTGKTQTQFTGLTLYSGSSTAISVNDEIIPFQNV